MVETQAAEGQKALEKVEKEQKLSIADQKEVLTKFLELSGKGIEANRDMVLKHFDLGIAREKTKVRLAEVEQQDRDSQRNYENANRSLDLLEKTLVAHFSERHETIREGFKVIDKALADGKWDAAVKVFSDMSNMVAQSPLSAAVALKDKIKSGKAITLDDF